MCQSAGRNCSTIDSPPTTTLVSASHRLAEHYDILWRIFSGQRGRGIPHPYLLSRADLARCTRVSRAFHEPAIRVLWSSLDGFVPLWQLLAPADLPYRPLYSQEYFRKVVDAHLWEDSECWNRFSQYARCVLTLHVPISHLSDGHGSATTSLWNGRLQRLLLKHSGGVPLLPSLVSLSWSWASVEDVYLTSMICQTLSELTIVFHCSPDPEDTMLTILRRLREVSPHLRSLYLRITNGTGRCIVDELVQLRNLRKLSLSPTLSPEEVHALLSMPYLTSLKANVSVEVASETLVSGRNLQTLELNGSSSDMTRLFTTLILPCLESLELNVFDTIPCGPELLACTRAVAQALTSQSLRRLHLTFNAAFDSSQPPLSDPSVSLPALLQPLLSKTHNLEGFTLRFDGPLKLWANDDVFEEMAQAWPSLRTLRLDFRAWHESGPVPTPAILTQFARFCPALHELVLPYLNHRIETDPALYNELHGHALRRLFIADDRSRGTASPDRVLPLAEMVSDLFPHLDLSFRSFIKNPGMPWWMVFDCLRASPTRPSASGLLHAASHSFLP